MAQNKLMDVVDELGPQFAQRTAEYDESDTFVADHYAPLKERKIFSAMVPKDLGGGGYQHSDVCEFLRGLARYCSSTALACSMHQHLVAALVWNHNHGKPTRATLEKVAADQLVLVSTGANDWLESNGSADRVEGGYRVTAKKPFASGSPIGNVLVTSVRYEDPKEGSQVLHVPIPIDGKHVTVGTDWQAHGMRGTGSNTVSIDGAFVPEEAVALRRPAGGYHPFFNVVSTVALPLIVSVYVGVAEAAAGKARAAAKKRQNEASLPYILGEMENALTTAQLAADSMVALANDLDFSPEVDRANKMVIRKTIAVNAVRDTARKALEAAGGGGYFRKAGIERLVRDAEAGHFHPLQEKRQHLYSGRIAMGLDPYEKMVG